MVQKLRTCLNCDGKGTHQDGRVCQCCLGTGSPDSDKYQLYQKILQRMNDEFPPMNEAFWNDIENVNTMAKQIVLSEFREILREEIQECFKPEVTVVEIDEESGDVTVDIRIPVNQLTIKLVGPDEDIK